MWLQKIGMYDNITSAHISSCEQLRLINMDINKITQKSLNEHKNGMSLRLMRLNLKSAINISEQFIIFAFFYLKWVSKYKKQQSNQNKNKRH